MPAMLAYALVLTAMAATPNAVTLREYVPRGAVLELLLPTDRLRLTTASGKLVEEMSVPKGSEFHLMPRPGWPREVIYAQPVREGRGVGAAITMVPMLSPQIATLASDGKTVVFTPDEEPEFAGWRTYSEQDLLLETSFGRMRFKLRPDAAPGTVGHIRSLVNARLYDGTIWHRIVAKRPDGSPFVIQGGDPAGTGSGGPGWSYPLEKSTLPHDRGVISIARSTDPNTNGCQLFVCLSRQGTRHLDGRYAAFGTMLEGDGVLSRLSRVAVGKNDRPLTPPKIERARLVPAYPRG